MFYDEKDNTIYFKNGCGYTDVVNSLSNFSHILSGTSLEPEVDLKLDGDTKNVTFPTYDCKIASKSIVNGKEVICMDIISDIVDVRVVGEAVIVEFADGTSEKAVRSQDDTFSLEQGISICITKKLLTDMTGNGSAVYNKIIKRAMKVKAENEKHAIEVAEYQEQQNRKAKKAEERKKRRKERIANAKREEAIEIQKEAYLRAMRELNK